MYCRFCCVRRSYFCTIQRFETHDGNAIGFFILFSFISILRLVFSIAVHYIFELMNRSSTIEGLVKKWKKEDLVQKSINYFCIFIFFLLLVLFNNRVMDMNEFSKDFNSWLNKR